MAGVDSSSIVFRAVTDVPLHVAGSIFRVDFLIETSVNGITAWKAKEDQIKSKNKTLFFRLLKFSFLKVMWFPKMGI